MWECVPSTESGHKRAGIMGGHPKVCQHTHLRYCAWVVAPNISSKLYSYPPLLGKSLQIKKTLVSLSHDSAQ